MATSSIDQAILKEISADAQKAKQWGLTFILSAILVLVLYFYPLPIAGFSTMAIITSIIFGGAGILFLLGSSTIPQDRQGIVDRLQKVMLDKNPKRRLWAAQRLVGYVKNSNFTKDDILGLALHSKNIIKTDPASSRIQPFIAVDHIVLLRELAVSAPMNKHTRKEFVTIIKPLKKLEWLPEDAVEILADAIAYHPSKLPVQAYLDYQKEEVSESEDIE